LGQRFGSRTKLNTKFSKIWFFGKNRSLAKIALLRLTFAIYRTILNSVSRSQFVAWMRGHWSTTADHFLAQRWAINPNFATNLHFARSKSITNIFRSAAKWWRLHMSRRQPGRPSYWLDHSLGFAVARVERKIQNSWKGYWRGLRVKLSDRRDAAARSQGWKFHTVNFCQKCKFL